MMRRLILLLLCAPAVFAADIAVTFDDLPVVTSSMPLARQREITTALVRTLQRRRIPAIGFVNAGKPHLALLQQWRDAGFELGNHTHGHRDLHRISAEEFIEEIRRGHAPLRTPRYFRHPFLHTGRSAETRAAVNAVLAELGYHVAPVTIDNSEWIFARAYDKAASPAMRKRVVDEYVPYMLAKAKYYDTQAKRLFGRSIAQVLLVHANALNADAFDRLAAALERDGHRFVSLDRALADPAYQSKDEYFGPAGLSWLDRWALTRGVPKGFFADEPKTAQWVQQLAGIEE